MGKWKLFLIISLVFLFCTLTLFVAFRSTVRSDPPIFSDGFESGDFSAWTGTTGTPSVQSTIRHSGIYAAQTSADSDRIYVSVGSAAAYARCYFRYDAEPKNNEEYEIADLNIGYAWDYLARALIVKSSGNIGWELKIDNGTNTYQNFTDPPQTNTWYCVELWFSQNTVNGSALWVNGVQILTADVTTHAYYSAISYYEVKQYSTSTTSPNQYFDDIVIDDSYIGPASHQVTFAQTGIGSDFLGAVVTVDGFSYSLTQLPVTFWWDNDTVHTFTYQSTLVVTANLKQYVLVSANASSPYTVSASATVTGSYKTQYYVTFNQDGLDGTATGTVLTVNGTAITYTGLPFSAWINSSDVLVFSYANVSSTASDMRFVVYEVNANSPLTVTGSVAIIGSYKTELLTMQLKGTKGWYWTQDTTITSTVQRDIDGDGNVEIITGGYYFDGARNVAQLVVWNGSNRAVKGVTVWYWYGDTTINSVAVGDVYNNGSMEIVTGGSYFDGVRHVAQLVVWDASTLTVRQVKVWTWGGDTTINSLIIHEVDEDGHMEIVTGGYYFDGVRNVAQLVVWDGSTLNVKQVKVWTWGFDTTINSLAAGDVDADGHAEIVTGGYYFDGTRDAAQLVVWDSTLAVKQLKVWSWGGNTAINSVAIGDVYHNGSIRIVTGGYYFDGSRDVAQLVIWNGSNMAIDGIKVWHWFSDTTIHSVAIDDVDQDGRTEIVTGGSYFDGSRDVSQLIVWDTSTLTVKQVAVWFGGGNTTINCVVVGDVNDDGLAEIVTGGNYYDGTRTIAQLTVWTAAYS